ncbi:DNA-directed RNA polymerase III subunit RPC3 [Drosophila rhopaloa]|uniref:DNA-directed RNA polymerase III subunit RPC3 n=1 Tax=Drosophila rhopaloa TaxID=1041015 RepID=A0ABM5HEE2_DRORH|nr:DNA-directed RNA polymerase III subunit RPC3 [Drosophila rhopaloa]XP_016979127.2 DNA-directed RNA polymerase III subunit RPC3 [Drosophila rhopaloa]
MSADYSHLSSAILEQCFGKVVQAVSDCLFSATTRTLGQITSATKFSRKEVALALAVLVKYRLVDFVASKQNPFLAEYALRREDVLCLLRYPRYIHLVQTKYGNVGASIAEELINSGSDTASGILIKCLTEGENKAESPESYRNTFLQMITDHYIIKRPELLVGDDQDESVPKFESNECDFFRHPHIDLQLVAKIRKGDATLADAKDNTMVWNLNCDRFHQDFRDTIMVDAIERKLGENAAECFRFILKIMYNTTDPWQRKLSNQITFVEIKQAIERKSNNLDLMKYLDQYISLLTDDSLGFFRRVGDMGGGVYVVDMEHAFESLAFVCVESVITERFGSKAARIFRVIRCKKYIEQEDLQKEAMIPSKEAKSLAYNLFQEQFIHVKIIKKPGGGSNGPAKAFYLFQVKEKDTVRMLLDASYKSLYNTIERSNFEKNEHKGLIEKSQRLDSIVETMKERGETDEYIAEIVETFTPPECEILNKVKNRIKTLSKAELTLDDTIFLLQMYQHHCTSLPTGIRKFK